MNSITVNTSKLPFDLRVHEACRNCKRFGFKASCPPNIPDINYYKKLLPLYNYCTVYFKEYLVNKETWELDGKTSSLEMQKFLMTERDSLFSMNNRFVTIFGSGSCKICSECSFPCKYPSKSLVPLEATGIDVVKLMRSANIKLTFPVTDTFYRVGAIFYG